MFLKIFKSHFLLVIFSVNLFVRLINSVEVEKGQNEKKINHLEEPLLSESSMTPVTPLCESGLSSNCPPLAVIFGREYVKLARPKLENTQLFFKKGKSEQLICACPEKIITDTEDEQPDNQTLIPDPKQSDGKKCSLNCQEEIVPFHRFDGEDCGGGTGKIMEIGYEKTHFLRLLTICYRFNDRRILFIRHKIRSFDFFPDANPRPTSITYQQIYANIETVYKEENQKQVFEQTFPENHKEYFVGPHDENGNEENRKYFVMRQLVDDADMVLTNWKKSTYFFVNTVPVWNTIENFLDSVNDQIRDWATMLKEEVIIYSGTYGFLRKSKKRITLADQSNDLKLSVPALIWKVIYLKKCSFGIVVIIHNNISPPKRNFCRRILDEDMAKINFTTSLYHYFCHLDDDLKAKIRLKNLNTKNKLNVTEFIKYEEFKNTFCDEEEETNEEFYMDEEMEDESEDESEDDELPEENHDSKETEDDEPKQVDHVDSGGIKNDESVDKSISSSAVNSIVNLY